MVRESEIPDFMNMDQPMGISPLLSGLEKSAQKPNLSCLLSKTELREPVNDFRSMQDYLEPIKPRFNYQNPVFAETHPKIYAKIDELFNEPFMEIGGITLSRADAIIAGNLDAAEPLVFLTGDACFEGTGTILHGNCGQEAILIRISEASKEQVIKALMTLDAEKSKVETTMRRFTSIIAHDLRAPLTITLGQAQISQRTVGHLSAANTISSEQISSLVYSLTAIVSSARKMNAQITDIVNILRASDQLKPILINPKDLLDSVFFENKDLTRTSNTKLLVDVPSDLQNIRLEKRIFNLIQNTLILNAIQAGAKEITLKAEEKDGYIVFTVIDNGKGMSKTAVDTCFMYTGSTTGGSGLMMVLAKETVEEDFGGTMSVESGEGKGTKFTISIPVYNPSEKTTKEAVVFND